MPCFNRGERNNVATSMLFGGDMPPEEREERERLQDGLPIPQNDCAALTVLKRDALQSVLPSSVAPIQFMASAIIACNELPAGTRRVSVVQSVLNAASLGLVFGSARGEAYLVTYKDGRATQKEGREIRDCNLIIGYKGFTSLAYQSSFLKSFTTELVLEGESAECWVDETGRKFLHKTPIGRAINRDGSNILAAYCQYSTRTGSNNVVVVQKDELDKARPQYSKIWDTNPGPMSMKTAIRRAAKEWAVTGQLAGAVTIDEQAEAGAVQSNLFDPRLLEEDCEPKSKRRAKTGVSDRQVELEKIKAAAANDARGGVDA